MSDDYCMKITVDDLREVFLKIIKHFEENGRTSFDIRQDYYWLVSEDARYDFSKLPTIDNLGVGQLSDDWENLKSMLDGEKDVLGYYFVWLSYILRNIGENHVGF